MVNAGVSSLITALLSVLLFHFNNLNAFRITRTALASFSNRPLTNPSQPINAAPIINPMLIKENQIFCLMVVTALLLN